ncbi:uncharacterized protein LOC128985051 [Macrosteles quadrilineatus]|uniref:uncharacterized protein LOC128985051 n=1 Tax=Macrosteles quadrilineatus TaxID=74068 RepID=UPI0023E15386|nr:uncharacterized protein LOC128985051 [Macrosteles quadrilineatus]
MTSDCGICGKSCDGDEEQKVKCAGSCEKFFHARCIQDDVVGTKTRSFRDWKCKQCREVVTTTNELLKVLQEFKAQMFDELKTTRNEITDLTDAMQFMSNKMDESTNLMKNIKEELASMKKENEHLRSDNAALNKEVTSLKSKVRALEQYSRKNNVEVSGIPETPNEDVMSLVKDVGTALGVEIQEGDISVAHRVPSYKKDRPPPLIIQFSRRVTRDTLLHEFRDRKKLNARQINPAFPEKSVYVNEHLAPENKLFLKDMKTKCKDIGYQYAWCRDGKFFVRKCENDRCIRIESCEDLNNLK